MARVETGQSPPNRQRPGEKQSMAWRRKAGSARAASRPALSVASPESLTATLGSAASRARSLVHGLDGAGGDGGLAQVVEHERHLGAELHEPGHLGGAARSARRGRSRDRRPPGGGCPRRARRPARTRRARPAGAAGPRRRAARRPAPRGGGRTATPRSSRTRPPPRASAGRRGRGRAARRSRRPPGRGGSRPRRARGPPAARPAGGRRARSCGPAAGTRPARGRRTCRGPRRAGGRRAPSSSGHPTPARRFRTAPQEPRQT